MRVNTVETSRGGHDELACLAGAVAMYQRILADAAAVATNHERSTDPETELRAVMPGLLAGLSPDARALIGDYWDHVAELVAFVYRAESHLAADR